MRRVPGSIRRWIQLWIRLVVGECVAVEAQVLRRVGNPVLLVVPPGPDVKLVLDATLEEDLVRRWHAPIPRILPAGIEKELELAKSRPATINNKRVAGGELFAGPQEVD